MDNVTDYSSRFYGLLEPLNDSGDLSYAAVVEGTFADTTDLVVLDNDTVFDVNTAATPASLGSVELMSRSNNFSELMTVTRDAGGWYNELGPLTMRGYNDGSGVVSTESRNYNGAIAIRSGVGFVKYAPDQSVCLPSGFSTLRFVDSRTGTASRNIFFDAVGALDSFNVTGDTEMLIAESETMQGAISKLTLVSSSDGRAVGSSDNYGGIQFNKVGSLPPPSGARAGANCPFSRRLSK